MSAGFLTAKFEEVNPPVPFVKERKGGEGRTMGTICTIQQHSVTLHGCFSRFLNCTNGTKSCNAPQIRDYDNSESYFYGTLETTNDKEILCLVHRASGIITIIVISTWLQTESNQLGYVKATGLVGPDKK